MCRLTRLVESSSSSSSSSSATAQLCTRLASLRSTLATGLPPRVLLPTLTKCYSNMVVDKKVNLSVAMEPAFSRFLFMNLTRAFLHKFN